MNSYIRIFQNNEVLTVILRGLKCLYLNWFKIERKIMIFMPLAHFFIATASKITIKSFEIETQSNNVVIENNALVGISHSNE